MVTVIGVINGDTQLHLADFRAAERTFQLLTQVAGRAGRRSPGRVVIQTQSVDHPALLAAQRHDYAMFAGTSCRTAQRLGYPPYRQLVAFRHQASRARRRRASKRTDSRSPSRASPIAPGGRMSSSLAPRPVSPRRFAVIITGMSSPAGEDLAPLLRSFPIPYGWTVDVDPVSSLASECYRPAARSRIVNVVSAVRSHEYIVARCRPAVASFADREWSSEKDERNRIEQVRPHPWG